MSLRTLPTLREVAQRSLLRSEAAAISALEDLPTMLFLPLFEEAFKSTRTNILKAMVQAWPFPCLPLGALMKRKIAYGHILQAALEGLDMLLAQKVRPRRWKLEVLDLRSGGQTSWNWRSATLEDGSLPQATCEKPTAAAHPGTGMDQPVRVVIDLNLKEPVLDGFVSTLFQLAEERKGLLQVCCRKLYIWELSLYNYKYIFEILDPADIQELRVHSTRCLYSLLPFASYLGQMCNLRQFCLCYILQEVTAETKQCIVAQLASQFLKLHRLQKLHISSVLFLEGHFDQLLRNLKTPLSSLSVTHCHLSESEWSRLPEHLSTSQLVHLNLTSVKMTHLNPEPFRVLLVSISATLVTLNLEDCCIGDLQVSAFLPALSQCSQLTTFNFYGNLIFMSTLINLLCHTAGLRHLSVELYPFPVESYDDQGIPQPERLAQHYAELVGILKAIREPKVVYFGTFRCSQCDRRNIYNMINVCDCWTLA
uniref:PRAME family member 12-like n=1 Tax=Jaculus jaculus TaxID=51337 RepID=UPI001E1B4591|nr:PRAME family member 12-like [Jaculus jaculus]